MLHVRVFEHLLHVVDGAARHIGGFHERDPLLHGARQHGLGNFGNERVAVAVALSGRGVALVRGQVVALDQLAQGAVLAIVAHRHDDIALFAAEYLVRHHVYGTMFEWALPMRRGILPDRKWLMA